jgi:signal transduction histidine kinase
MNYTRYITPHRTIQKILFSVLLICAGMPPTLWSQDRFFWLKTYVTDSADVHQLLGQSKEYNKRAEWDSARYILQKAIIKSRQLNYKAGMRGATANLMLIAYNKSEFDEAIRYAQALIRLCDTTSDQQDLQSAYNVMGLSYDAIEDFKQAFDHYTTALKYAVDGVYRAMICNNMSVLMQNVKQYEKALGFIDQGLSENPNGKLKKMLYTNKASVYKGLQDYGKALMYFDSALVYAGSPNEIADVHCRRMFFFNTLKAGKEALAELKALEPYLAGNEISMQNRAKINMAASSAYVLLGDYQKAGMYLQRAQALSGSLLNSDKRVLQHKLVDYYYTTGNYKKAYDLHAEYHEMEDSIRSREIQVKVSEQETRYRTAQKDKLLAKQRVRLLENDRIVQRNWTITAAMVTILVVLLLLAWLRYSFQKRRNQALQDRQEINRLQLIMEGEERERTRLSRELHDGVNSSLAATASYVRIVEQQYPAMQDSVPFQKVKQLLQSTSNEVRTVAHNLASQALMKGGLKQALDDYCHNLFPPSVSVEIQVLGDESVLPANLQLVLYRIAQELLHNVYKHAHATEVIVQLVHLEHELRLTVEDNGLGMQEQDELGNGIGLENVRARVKAFKGSIHIETGAAGTAVHIAFPLLWTATHGNASIQTS